MGSVALRAVQLIHQIPVNARQVSTSWRREIATELIKPATIGQ